MGFDLAEMESIRVGWYGAEWGGLGWVGMRRNGYLAGSEIATSKACPPLRHAFPHASVADMMKDATCPTTAPARPDPCAVHARATAGPE